MEKNKVTFASIDEYILQFPPDVQEKLFKLRQVIKECAPEAEEKISYQMPTFAYYGNLVYFAAYKKHIGFYPTSSGITAFGQKLSSYKSSKGTVQFPIDQPLPYELIKQIVLFRVAENRRKAEKKR
ncbi:iron chaperone [Ectobacillus sp. sgz5001026]|uniref:iron chaperone n=1 Tax=Ectobacillus sp. sgz5001026 TaxID=3242473 RepID=UPI0036D2C89D